jgi:DNA-binding HxlR family transcriptional regulator
VEWYGKLDRNVDHEGKETSMNEEHSPMTVMADQQLGVRPCSAAAALEIVGERWSLLAIREMSYGVHTFAKIAGFTGASRDILADRLRKLEDAGIIERRQYCEHPLRFEYHLAQAGWDLLPVLIALTQWGDKWAVDNPALRIQHSCGHTLISDLVCSHCSQVVNHSDMTPMLTKAAH